jgi:uncharacterized LabA/DUF88 family protein
MMKEGTSTFLQIDLQNLYSANHKQKIDLEKMWKHFNERETEMLMGAIVYTVRSPEFDSASFETKLKMIGYDIRTKSFMRVKKSLGKIVKEIARDFSYKGFFDQDRLDEIRELATTNLDVILTMECLIRKDLFDKWILVSNNGAFSDVCRYLREIGKKVEVWCFKDSYDASLELYVDKLRFIDEDFCLKRQAINIFGIYAPPEGLEEFDSTSIQGLK